MCPLPFFLPGGSLSAGLGDGGGGGEATDVGEEGDDEVVVVIGC
jgi:hypothetical protein